MLIDELRAARAELHRGHEPGSIEHVESLGLARLIARAIAALEAGRDPGPIEPEPSWRDFPRPWGVVGRDEREGRRCN